MTKRIIKEALTDLLREKELAKVSVTELCQAADINRSTFYAHYQDVFAVLEEMTSEFINVMVVVQRKDIEPQVIHILQYVYEHKELLLLLLRNDIGFRYRLLGEVTEALVKEFPMNNGQEKDSSDPLLYYGFIAAGSLYLIEQWARGEVCLSANELNQQIMLFSRMQESYAAGQTDPA